MNYLLASGTILAQIIIIFLLICLLFKRCQANKVYKFFFRYKISLTLVIVIIGTLGSLFFSEIKHFIPCELCWAQRILLAMQIIILPFTYKYKRVIKLAQIFVIAGIIVALYHNYIYWQSTNTIFCDPDIVLGSCTISYVQLLGYITIPTMSLTIFVLLLFILSTKQIKERQE